MWEATATATMLIKQLIGKIMLALLESDHGGHKRGVNVSKRSEIAKNDTSKHLPEII